LEAFRSAVPRRKDRAAGPSDPGTEVSVPTPPTEIIRPPRAAALVAVGALAANALLLPALAAAGLWAMELVDRDGFTRRTDDVLDALAYGAAGQVALTVLTGVAMIVWLWRARGVADVIEAPYGWGRPWTIFGWFVPVMSLWIPRSVVAALWRASGPGRAAWPVNAWWAAWVGYLLGGRAVDLDLSGSRGHIRHEVAFYVADLAAGTVAALLAALVVWRITRFQEAQAVRLAQAVAAPVRSPLEPPAPKPVVSDPAGSDPAVSDPA
jgi:hypothetical protein